MAKQKKQEPSGPWLVVMNYGKREEVCSGCGGKALIFSADHTAKRQVFSRCKECLMALAVADGLIVHVKTTWPRLVAVWAKNRRVEAPPGAAERMAAIRAKTPQRGADYGKPGKITGQGSLAL